MKIIIIRHGKVNMKWPKWCDSESFDRACAEYDLADIVRISKPCDVGAAEHVYVSHLRRSHETAKQLFDQRDYSEMENIYEVPLRSFTDLNIRLPLWIWNVTGRLQWYFGSRRQDEGRTDTIKRADLVIAELEKRSTDCILITHGFFMKTLVKRLKKCGYDLSGYHPIGFGNLQSIY